MLIRNILEESVQKFGEVKAVKWLNRKEVLEKSYSEMMKNVISTRKGLLGVERLNIILQKYLNPSEPGKTEEEINGLF